MPNKNGQKKKKEIKRDVWLRGGEKERMHGDSVEIRDERTSKEEFKEVHY